MKIEDIKIGEKVELLSKHGFYDKYDNIEDWYNEYLSNTNVQKIKKQGFAYVRNINRGEIVVSDVNNTDGEWLFLPQDLEPCYKIGEEHKRMQLTYQKPLKGEVGVVFGSFAPLHQGHLDLIYKAKKENIGGVIVICCGYERDKGEPRMTHAQRYRSVRKMFEKDELVAVYAINDTELGLEKYPNGWDGWMKEFERIFKIAVEDINVKRTWYVGDQNYYDDLIERKENVILVDRLKDNPICATMIRKDPLKHWNKITQPFKKYFSHNILITGTASEGKSTLVEDIGKYFNIPYSYEWPREYIEENNLSDWEFRVQDFLTFLTGQYNLNKKCICSNVNRGVFIADTDSLVTKMYAEYYSKDESCLLTEEDFKVISMVADTLAQKSRWDKIFLVAPHGVFVDDHSRYMKHSGMNEREELFELLCKNIKQAGDWDKVVILTGNYQENFETVVKYIRGLMIC